MTRLKTIPMALGGLALSAGAVFGFATMPSTATHGLENATEKSGHTLPARPATVLAHPDLDVPGDAENEDATEATDKDETTPDAPKAGTHGTDVSAVARAADTTPDTNHGADVSAVAKANHGQAISATHRPATAGKPTGAGKSR